MIALTKLLGLERPTTKAIPYSEWPEEIKVILEDDEALKYYEALKITT